MQQFTPYESCVRKLYSVDNVKRDLLNMELLYDALKQPMDNPAIKVIHIAGTNGKGSVALKISKALELAGHTVGLVTSPHISSFRERIQINSVLISEEEVGVYLPQVLTICEEQNIPATFFEITTALAFLYFSQKAVDVVVLETGLGGRLDATNVVRYPCLCVITSIGLEHTALLGDTVQKIAVQKAGIIKVHVPLLVGPNVPHAVIRKCAKEKGAEGYYTCEDVLQDHGKEVVSTTSNDNVQYIDYDAQNSRTATAALRLLLRNTTDNVSSTPDRLFTITDDHIKEGTAQRPICRFEELKHPVLASNQTTTLVVDAILDIAHNPPALHFLRGKLDVTHPQRKKRLVVGFSADKDLTMCAQTVLSMVPDPSSIHLVEAINIRAAKLEAIFEAEPKLGQCNYDKIDRSVTVQIASALQLALKHDEILVICGSVFLMSEAREALGVIEPRDSKQVTSVAGSGLQKCKERLLLTK